MEAPEQADVILVVGILEAGAFKNLRTHPVWKRFPESSFGYYEGDNPPGLLHGVYASATRLKGWGGRMRSSAYPVVAIWRPNPPPPQPPAYLAPKRYLMSFVGRRSHRVRKQLLSGNWPAPEVLFDDTTGEYNRFYNTGLAPEEHRSRYWQALAASKFAICPRGAGAASIRLFEAMSLGVAPVIISDNWLPPEGPDWNRFAIFVPEADVRSLYERVRAHEGEWEARGRAAQEAFQTHFSPERILHHILDSVESIARSQLLSERWFVRVAPFLTVIEWGYQARWNAEVGLKRLLKGLTGRG